MPKGLFSQYRIGRDYLYAGGLTFALGLVLAVFALTSRNLGLMFGSILLIGLGFGFIFAAVVFEIRMKALERMANKA